LLRGEFDGSKQWERGLAGLKLGQVGRRDKGTASRLLAENTILAIEVNVYTGKARTLNDTEELYLKARQFKRRVIGISSAGGMWG
jgi:hypothetical protein